ncbi:hypothetical protein EXN67_29080 [Rhizobium rhizogenes]|uniref:DUF3800 domain-containing protein n=2 Tax=Rhizobium rhizogenes TaxID=359 RepID=A0AA87QFT8_RHIRH|nr:DUF3800 domain-containing protein [Rhizobium rhizogenes]GAJ96074.1 hypothetical protein RRH01S_16_00240 [Rhizobium rhizogenes NBRC 13257]NTG91081.1 DUF3800 domain-containing protein [Rhizobium rhizogenes]TRB03450.1 hypothetical protein EXN67_29080 [Rhizobium rhizogenes]TRB38192.1 hypothetical protein EXN73_28645 [Rhizobium rhizogenes]
MECFRIDESGYTGFDLLNAEQRFQGASAIAIEDDEAARLIRNYFPRLQAGELKYRSLSRRPGNHERLLGLLRDIHTHFECVTYVCDKRYLLTLMFVDYAVEPFYYERGHDLYVDGGNYAMASLLYTVGPTLFGWEGFDELMTAFQLAVKEKSPLSRIRLVSAARNIDWRRLEEVLGPITQACPDCWQAIVTPGVNTDAAWIVLQSLISRMEAMANGVYRVEHDQSKNLLAYHAMIKKFIDHDEEIEFRTTEIASLKFPLKLTEVVQVDSKRSPAVQLADVMIGAAIEGATTMAGIRAGGLDPEEVSKIYADGQFIHMSPTIDFEENRRFRKGSRSSEMIDYFAEHFSDRDKGGRA